MLPDYYEFSCPVKIVSGFKALDNIPFEMKHLGVKRAMVITDSGVEKAGLIKLVKKAFSHSHCEIGHIFNETPSDSSFDVVNHVAGLFRETGCDSLLAVGGGSVIDTAKGVNIIVSENSSDIARFIGNECLESPQKPLLAIPTTTGTGSEASYVAVITDTKTDTKMFFLSYHLFPRVAILDPRMTQTCPASIIAATAMDALSHAMEAYIGLQKNPMSDAYAISAINLIREHLLEAVKESKSGNHRFGLANAACMAGIAFSSSMPGVVHTLGQAVGAVCHLHHGAAMAIFLPIGLEYNLAKRATEIGELLLPLGGRDIYANTPQESRHTKVIELVKDLRLSLSQLTKLPISLSQAGVDRERFEDISKYAVGDGTILYNAEDISYDDILQLLEKAYD